MSGITLNTVFNNPNLPKTKSHKESILNISSLRGWHQGDRRHCDVSSLDITRFLDISSNNNVFSVSTPSKAKLIDGDAISGFSATKFGESSPNVYSSSYDYDLSQPFTWAVLFKPKVGLLDGQSIMGRFDSSSSKVLLNAGQNAKTFVFMYDAGGLNFDFQDDEWMWLIVSYDGATTIKGYSSNDATVKNGTVNGPSSVSAPMLMGALALNGSQYLQSTEISDVLLFDSDLIGSGNEKLVESYFRDVYGI